MIQDSKATGSFQVREPHYLSDFGVEEKSFSIAGYADTRPYTVNDTPETRAYNRRVDIIMLDEGHF